MTAETRTVDFSKSGDFVYKPSGRLQDGFDQPISADGKLLTPKQIRARARRRRKRGEHLSEQEMDHLYQKPVEEWDLEELARGRPRNINGKFSGPAPSWVDRTVFENSIARFTQEVKGGMRATTVDALRVIGEMINNDDVDDKGKPLVAASTKADLAKFLLEHVVGKPTQRFENDVSVKLQGILGQVLVNPSHMASGNYMPAHYPGVTMELATGPDDDEEIVIDG